VIELDHALERSIPQLAELQARCLAGHPAPPPSDPEQFAHRLALNAIDLGASWIASYKGEDVGLALVARRGGFSRVDTLGVVPDDRRHGVGRSLIDAVLAWGRARGDVKLIVEVLSDNMSALELYRATGFHEWRQLVGWERNAPNVLTRDPSRTVSELQLRHAAWACARHADKDLPWQLAPETIANLAPPYRSFEHNKEAYCVVRLVDDQKMKTRTMEIAALIVRTEARGRGLGAVVLAGACKALNADRIVMPPLCPEGMWDRFFQRCGFERSRLQQTELRRAIEKAGLG
jgi:GNAT superfamily N-acetyltransferase